MNNFRLQILDIAKGLQVSKKLKFYLQTINWTREQVKHYQLLQLQHLIEHTFKTVPYYIDFKNKYNFDIKEISTLNDLKKLPVIDRDVIQKNNEQLISNLYDKNKLGRGSSSGTTGIPIHYYYDKNAESSGIAAGYALYAMTGKMPGMKNFYVWGNEYSIKRWKTLSSKAKNFLMRQKNIASTLINNPENIPSIIDELKKFKPKFIEGYPGAIYTLANYCLHQNIKISGLNAVLCTAENIEEPHRKVIEQVFAPTADLYGSGEVLGVAIRPVHENKYYILEPHIIIEIEKTGIDGMHEVLLTDLDNYAMPFIRYKIGDLIDELYEPDKNSKYPFSYFTKILGRTADIIKLPNGKMFHPVNIFGGTTFRQFKEITRHKVVWNGEELKIIFEMPNKTNIEDLEKIIAKLLDEYQVKYSIEYVEKILPGKSGKYRYVEIINK